MHFYDQLQNENTLNIILNTISLKCHGFEHLKNILFEYRTLYILHIIETK